MASGKVDKCDIGDLSISNKEPSNSDDDESLGATEKIEFTSSEDLKSVTPYDNTVEIIGYVDGMESPKLVGAKNNKIFKFFLNNNNGERIQVTSWNAECDRIEPMIRTNYIVHVDGAYAKPSSVKNFNKGSVTYELIVQSNTMVNVLGKHIIQETEVRSELVLLSDILNHKNLICTRGFIKSNFYVIKNQVSSSADYACGSITDGKYKLEVRISGMDIENSFSKGDHVEIKGFTQFNANPVYLLTSRMSSIRLVDNQKMSVKKLIRGNKVLEKLQRLPVDNQDPARKARKP